MVFIEIHCPDCQGEDVVKFGRQPNGEQRYRCKNPDCQRVFLLNYQDKGRLPEVKQKVIDMALNGSGIRDTARVLGISQMTVMDVLKRRAGVEASE